MILYEKRDRIATVTLNRPEKQNALHPTMWAEMDAALADAQHDPDIRVIILQGAGESFCAGFDFSGGLQQYHGLAEDGYDPGMDVMYVTNPFTAPIPAFMRIWRRLEAGHCQGAWLVRRRRLGDGAVRRPGDRLARTPASARPTRGSGGAI